MGVNPATFLYLSSMLFYMFYNKGENTTSKICIFSNPIATDPIC